MHKMSKILFANNKFFNAFFNFGFFHFSEFQMAILKNFMELPSFFKMDFERSYKVLQNSSV